MAPPDNAGLIGKAHGRVLHVGDCSWHCHGLRAFDFFHYGLWLFCRRDGIEPSAAGKGWAGAAFVVGVIGVVMALMTIALG